MFFTILYFLAYTTPLCGSGCGNCIGTRHMHYLYPIRFNKINPFNRIFLIIIHFPDFCTYFIIIFATSASRICFQNYFYRFQELWSFQTDLKECCTFKRAWNIVRSNEDLLRLRNQQGINKSPDVIRYENLINND